MVTLCIEPEKKDALSGDLVLRIHGTSRDGQILRLKASKCTIGSSAQCTLRLHAPGVAPVDCLILRGRKRAIVRRWSPRVRLNGQAFADAELFRGDRLGIGPLELEVLDLDRVELKGNNGIAEGELPASPERPICPSSEAEWTMRELQLRREQEALLRQHRENDEAYTALETAQECFSTEKKAFQHEVEEFRQAQEQIVTEKKQLDEEKVHFQTQTEELQESEATLQRELESVGFQTEMLRKQAEELRQQTEALAARESALNNREENCQAREREFQAREDMLQTRRAEEQTRQAEHDAQHAAWERRCSEWDSSRQQWESQKQADEEALRNCREELRTLQQTLETERHELEAREEDLQAQRELLRSRQEDLQRAEQRLEERRTEWESERAALAGKSSAVEDTAPEVTPAEIGPKSPQDAPDNIQVIFQRLGYQTPGDEESESSAPASPPPPMEPAATEAFEAESEPGNVVEAEPAPVHPVEEESIDDYMTRLMERVRAVQGEGSDVRHALPPPPTTAERSFSPPTVASQTAQRETEDLAPRAVAPEKRGDITALRDLANLTAHAALNTHAQTQLRHVTWSKLSVGVLAFLSGIGLLVYWRFFGAHVIVYFAALAAFLAAILWSVQYALLTGRLIINRSGNIDVRSARSAKKDEGKNDGGG